MAECCSLKEMVLLNLNKVNFIYMYMYVYIYYLSSYYVPLFSAREFFF